MATDSACTTETARAIRELLQVQLAQYQRSAHRVLHATRPADLHALRVSLRRLIGILRLLQQAGVNEARSLRRALRALVNATSEARDLDVLLAQRPRRAATRLVLQPLTAQWRRRREGAQLQMSKVLQGPSAARAVQGVRRLAALADAPGSLLAIDGGRLLRRHHRRLRREARAALAGTSAERLHRLRLQAKRLRYVAEPLLPLYGKSLARYLERLRELLELLGALNDAHQMQLRLAAFAGAVRTVRGRAALAAWRRQCQRARARARSGLTRALRRAQGRRWRKLRRKMQECAQRAASAQGHDAADTDPTRHRQAAQHAALA